MVEEDAVSEVEWFKRMAMFQAKQKAMRLACLELALGIGPCQESSS
jgi:hypothetical protein